MIAKTFRTPALLSALVLVVGALGAGPASAAPAPSPTLSVTFSATSASVDGSLPYGTSYVVSGCGYVSSGVTVVVHSPEAISFAGQTPDATGCISISNFSTQGAGHYEVDAFQQIHGGTKSSMVASTSFDLK